ncbi:unnamed protein product, partial [Amoebophrya sp. A25]
HAGFLLGLGLRGFLTEERLPVADCYKYLKLQHEVTTVALLLGLAASHIGLGSKQTGITRMCALHISFSFEAPPSVRAASSLGLGLLYAQTGQRGIAEMLAKELHCSAYRDECQQLAAAFGLGLVSLGKQGLHRDLVLLNLPSAFLRRLAREMAASYSLGSGDMNEEDLPSAVLLEPACRDFFDTASGDGQFSQAACLALSLMYLCSNDRRLATRIPLPRNGYQLNATPPDLLAARMIARGLILWDDVKASKSWILGQVPLFLLRDFDLECENATDFRALCELFFGEE